ncbi:MULTISPECIES: hypothetical protein [Lysobacter]|uniref:hypothetical protein n=1 Tax=Lysobacter TaxID=68 RepID=UPI001F2907E4|nr:MULTISPECIES: hypothetical protein [Lysobacter]UJB19203.1 hypothetical protein L1A79_23310 [Lysobacter capsici]UJQ27072.1 hypothetical protein L2D09_16575 [Lysobacter gummosus]
MHRFHGMTFRIFVPGVFLILSSLLSLWLIDSFQSNPFSAALLNAFRFAPLLLFGAGALSIFYAIYLLWQWELGKGTLCECGGILGMERSGRWGDYRKCMACRRNVNRQYYE